VDSEERRPEREKVITYGRMLPDLHRTQEKKTTIIKPHIFYT
jgi:hypothetical protein